MQWNVLVTDCISCPLSTIDHTHTPPTITRSTYYYPYPLTIPHYIGHGPMSHMFDRQFLQIHGLTHEIMSTRMFDALVSHLATRGMIGATADSTTTTTSDSTPSSPHPEEEPILTWDECTLVKELIRPETARPEVSQG